VLLHGLLGTARNFGTLQRQVATSRRVVALDLRNHGASAHGDAMDYPTMAADVRETLAQHAALPAMIMGHSMGGKVAMRLALEHPDTVARLLVSDIAPVAYPATDGALVQAMAAITLSPGLTRASADAQLRTSVPDPAIRAFLLQNLRPGESPSWRVGLRQIAAALPAITGWPTPPTGATYGGPTLFVAGARSDYIEAAARPVIRGLFPEARFVKVKDAGHWVHADNPAAFLAVLEGFCAAT
jgi:pimeloyl-ACP methyl ester carboxylesterase